MTEISSLRTMVTAEYAQRKEVFLGYLLGLEAAWTICHPGGILDQVITNIDVLTVVTTATQEHSTNTDLCTQFWMCYGVDWNHAKYLLFCKVTMISPVSI